MMPRQIWRAISFAKVQASRELRGILHTGCLTLKIFKHDIHMYGFVYSKFWINLRGEAPTLGPSKNFYKDTSLQLILFAKDG
jgi:hypothetical protein